MALTGTPNNYNLVDTREEMFSTVNTNTEKTKQTFVSRRPPAHKTTMTESSCLFNVLFQGT